MENKETHSINSYMSLEGQENIIMKNVVLGPQTEALVKLLPGVNSYNQELPKRSKNYKKSGTLASYMEEIASMKPIQETTELSDYFTEILDSKNYPSKKDFESGGTVQKLHIPVFFPPSTLPEVDSVIDLSGLDYQTAAKRLSERHNKPWKLKPRDIADFYILERTIAASSNATGYKEDTQNVAELKAKDRISSIGRRLLVALMHEQLTEYDRWTHVAPEYLPEDIKDTLYEFYHEKGMKKETSREDSHFREEMNYYLSAFYRDLQNDGVTKPEDSIFEDPQRVNTVLRVLESQQTGNWKEMARSMRCLFDPSHPVTDVVRSTLPKDASPEIVAEAERLFEQRREILLIDKLINALHQKGNISARISNDFPDVVTLLVAHGIPGLEGYVYSQSSYVYDYDSLGMQVRRTVDSSNERDVTHDINEYAKKNLLPLSYQYALLLKFGTSFEKEGLITQISTIGYSFGSTPTTPTSAMEYLSTLMTHDGFSNGRLNAA